MQHEEALRKVMGLLRLSKSANENEAALAASKAQEIINKYKLDVTALDYEEQDKKHENEGIVDFNDDPLDNTNQRDSRWGQTLASTLARNNGCRIYICRQHNLGLRISIVGRPSDVQTVRYMYSWLQREVLRLAKDNCVGRSGTYFRHYCLGVVDTIRMRLAQQQKETFAEKRAELRNNSMALVKVNNAIAKIEKAGEDVQKWMDDNLDLGKGRNSSLKAVTGGRQAGQRDGHQVRFNTAKGALGSGTKQLN